jgi:quercetin dioxygenase-like cupin family protein
MIPNVLKKENEIPWKPHPVAQGVEIKPLLTNKDDKTGISCLLVRAKAGIEIPEHVHEEAEDIIYPLSGKAKFYVEGFGEGELVKGVLVRVPKNTKHRIFDIEEDLLAYDVFTPALF